MTVADDLNARIQQIASTVVAEVAQKELEEAQHKAPVDTGALRAGIHISKKTATSATVSSGVPYDVYQEMGTSKQHGTEHYGLRSGIIYSNVDKWVKASVDANWHN